MEPEQPFEGDDELEQPSFYEEEKLNNSNKFYLNSAKWQVCTSLAESVLFRSLSSQHTFQFYYLYLIFMNVSVTLSAETKCGIKKLNTNASSLHPNGRPGLLTHAGKYYLFNFINERMFMHQFFRFVELDDEADNVCSFDFNFSLLSLVNLLKKFSGYLRFVLDKYKTLNRPNYFDLNKPILSASEHKCLLRNNFSYDLSGVGDLLCQDMVAALAEFDLVLNNSLFNKLQQNASGLAKLVSSFYLHFYDSLLTWLYIYWLYM